MHLSFIGHAIFVDFFLTPGKVYYFMRLGLWCKPTCLLMYQDKGRGLRLVSPCLKTQKKKILESSWRPFQLEWLASIQPVSHVAQGWHVWLVVLDVFAVWHFSSKHRCRLFRHPLTMWPNATLLKFESLREPLELSFMYRTYKHGSIRYFIRPVQGSYMVLYQWFV